MGDPTTLTYRMELPAIARLYADNILNEPAIPPLLRNMADEIELLREAIRRLADQDATLSVQGGNVIVTMDATLTDAEREAIATATDYMAAMGCRNTVAQRVLGGLLGRLK